MSEQRHLVSHGLRGAAVVLVVLATIAPELSLDPRWLRPWDGLLTAGDVAVSVLLAGTGFVMTEQLRLAASTGVARYLRVVAIYLLGTVALVALVAAVVLLVAWFAPGDATPSSPSWPTIEHLATFRMNSWLHDHPLGVAADLAGLWYFSVELQLVLVLAATAWLTRVRWWALPALASGLAVAAWLYRAQLLDDQGWFVASLAPGARGDAFFVGVVAACIAPRLRPVSGLVGGGLLLLVGSLVSLSFVDVEDEVMVVAPLAAAFAAFVLVGARRGGERELATRLWSGGLAGLGAHWRAVVAWTAPVFVLVEGYSAEAQLLAPGRPVAGRACRRGRRDRGAASPGRPSPRPAARRASVGRRRRRPSPA